MSNLALNKLPLEKEWLRPEQATDGNSISYSGLDGFTEANFPCNYTIDLEKPLDISVIRFKLWDGLGGDPNITADGRQYRYRLFISRDNKNWQFVWGTNEKGFNGWQVFEFQKAQKARYVKLECIHNTVNKSFHIVEFEVHDIKPEELSSTNYQFIPDILFGIRSKVDSLVNEIEKKSSGIDEVKANIQNWNSEIKSLYDLLKSEEERIKNLNQQFLEAEQTIQKAKEEYAGLQQKNTDGQTIISALTELNTQAQKANEALKQEKTNIETLANEVRVFYDGTFKPLSTQIGDIKNNVEAHHTQSGALYSQITEFRKKAEELLNKLAEQSSQGNQKYNEIDNWHKQVQALFDKVTNQQDGIQVKLEQINQLKGKIEEIAGSIQGRYDIANQQTQEITNNKTASDKILIETAQLKEEVNKNYNESTRLKGDIGKILDLVRDAGLADSWDKRRKRSQTSLYIWGVIIAIGVGLSYFLINKYFLSDEGKSLFEGIQSDYVKFLLRMTLTTPGVFLAWFASSQYSKERYFLEQYEFKTAAALALENYTTRLKQNYPEDKQSEIFNLNIDLIRKIYREPVFYKSKTKLNGKVKAPISDTEGEINIDAAQ